VLLFWRHADVDCNARPILPAAARARSAPLLFCCYPLFLRLRRRRQSRIPAAKEGLSLIICGKNSRKQRNTAVFWFENSHLSISGARGKQASADRDVVDQPGMAEMDGGEDAG